MFEFTKLGLVTTFGRDKGPLLRKARVRLVALVALLLAFTGLMVPALRQLPLYPGLPKWWWLVVITVGVQLLAGISLLMGQAILPSRSALARLMVALPIGPVRRWLVINAPGIILGCLLLVLIIQPLWLVVANLGLPTGQVVGAVGIGLISGFGLASYQPSSKLALRLGLAGLIAADEILLLKKIIIAYFEGQPSLAWYSAAALILVIPVVWLVISVYGLTERLQQEQNLQTKTLSYSSNRHWYFAKLLRHRRIAGAFAVTIALSSLVAISALYHQTAVGDGGVFLIVAAVLASAFATDARGAVKKFKPPEITGLYGVVRFMRTQLLTVTLLSMLATAPIGFAVIALSNDGFIGMKFVVLMLFSSAVGLAVSESLVTGGRDVSGQLLSASLCVSLLIGLPKLSSVLAPQQTTLGYAVLAVTLFGLCFLIERIRNNFVWRNPRHVRPY